MNRHNLPVFILLLLIPHFIYSQVNAAKGYSDTLSIRSIKEDRLQNQACHPQWIGGAIVPAGLFIAGAITLKSDSGSMFSKYTIHDKVRKMFAGAQSHLDNYLQFVPLAAVFGLNMSGIKGRSDLINLTVITAKAELLMSLIVRGMKEVIQSPRPSGGANSMPSGHTAQAFVSATILDMEYRDTSPWISVAGYAAATTTGLYRMINDQHWISDVLVGAGIGILSTKAVYFTHRYRWGKKRNIVILPSILKNGGGISFGMVI